jgi:hypothetical protein
MVEMLTATFNGFGHDVAYRQASRSTHAPISRIMPLSSAIGMKLAGDTMPRLGLFQRRRASNPVI